MPPSRAACSFARIALIGPDSGSVPWMEFSAPTLRSGRCMRQSGCVSTKGTTMTISKRANSRWAAQPDPVLPDNCVEWNREGQSGHWSKIHGRTWLCSGPMSWAPSKDELRSLERFSRYGWDTSRVMREYSNQLFELIDLEYDLKESALAFLEQDGPIDFDHEHSHRECRRQTKR